MKMPPHTATRLSRRLLLLLLGTSILGNTPITLADEKQPAPEPMAADGAAWDPLPDPDDLPSLSMPSWNAANPNSLTSLGTQNGFYRYTQLQGHLIQDGLNLYEVPEWWTTGSDFPYLKKNTAREVFFVDNISITRFLGGYNQDWKHGGTQLPSNDLAYVDDKGKVQYRLELVEQRLRPYLDNGYTSFIIGIENVPWDLAREPNLTGPYGNASPPRDWNEWHDFVLAVCQELRRVLPPESIEQLKFKIGNEYNQKKSFKGSHEDFLKLYDYSAAAIQKVFPQAGIMPGEIGGGGRHPDNAIDYPDLFQHFVDGQNRTGASEPPPVHVLARSSHSFPHVKDLSPQDRVHASVQTMAEVLDGKPRAFSSNLRMEHHQFGVLGAPNDPSAQQTGVRVASWHFQSIFRLKAASYLDNVWSWDKAERIVFPDAGETHLMNSIGWLYSILDHLQGQRMHLLAAFQPVEREAEVTAAAFAGDDQFTLIIASWTPADAPVADPYLALIQIPESIIPFPLQDAQARYLRLDPKDNPFAAIRADLREAGLLNATYANPLQPTARLRDMAADYTDARRLVRENLQSYSGIQQASLRLQPATRETVRVHAAPRAGRLDAQVQLKPNDVLVIQFAANR